MSCGELRGHRNQLHVAFVRNWNASSSSSSPYSTQYTLAGQTGRSYAPQRQRKTAHARIGVISTAGLVGAVLLFWHQAPTTSSPHSRLNTRLIDYLGCLFDGVLTFTPHCRRASASHSSIKDSVMYTLSTVSTRVSGAWHAAPGKDRQQSLPSAMHSVSLHSTSQEELLSFDPPSQ